MAIGSGIFDKVLDLVGSVYVFRVGSETFDAQGDGSIAWSQFTGTGYVEELSSRDESFRGGALRLGDARGYFSASLGSVVAGSIIEVSHKGEWFRMTSDPIIPLYSGNQLIKEVFLSRKVD